MFEPSEIHVEAKRGERVGVEFEYKGDGELSNPSSSCSCSTPTVNGKKLQMYIATGTAWNSTVTKYAYVEADSKKYTLAVHLKMT